MRRTVRFVSFHEPVQRVQQRRASDCCLLGLILRLQPSQSVVQSGPVAASLVLQLLPRRLQQILIAHVGRAVKEPSEDRVLLRAVRRQEAAELALRQHDDPAELLRIQTDQLRTFVGDVACAGDRRESVPGQGRGGLGLAVFIRAADLCKVQGAPDRIVAPVLAEGQRDLRVRCPVHQIAVHHVRTAVGAAGLAVESEDDAVKNRGFAGARVAGDQIKALGEAVKSDHGFHGIGAEGRQFQYERFHLPASFARRSRRSASAASASGPSEPAISSAAYSIRARSSSDGSAPSRFPR